MAKVKITKKQQSMARTYKKLGYSEPRLLPDGNVEVEKLNSKGSGIVVQVIDPYGTTIKTRSKQVEE